MTGHSVTFTVPFESKSVCLCFASLLSLLCLTCCETGRTALFVQPAALVFGVWCVFYVCMSGTLAFYGGFSVLALPCESCVSAVLLCRRPYVFFMH